MAYKLIISDYATDDLEEIIRYITENLSNPTAAASFMDEVEKCYENLACMPAMYEQCRLPRFKKDGYRRAVIKNYVMVYRINEAESKVIILRFFYGSRDYEKYL